MCGIVVDSRSGVVVSFARPVTSSTCTRWRSLPALTTAVREVPGAPACGKAWTICKVLAKYMVMKHYI